MSLTLGLNTALSGLITSQRGLDVISQNVVNLNTVGYTRKVMNPESRVVSGQGAGVQEGSVTRMVSEGLLKDIRAQQTVTGQLEVEQDYYPRIDDLFGEVGDSTSVAHKMNDLFSAFQTLSGEVNKPSTQWAAVQSAQNATDTLSSMTTSLQNMRLQADADIESTVSQINELLTTVNDLNQKIVKNSAVSTGTSDLEDKRDKALTDLSKLVDIQYFKRNDGAVTIYSSSGQMLLDNQPMTLSYASTSVTDSWMNAASGQFGKITISGGTTDFASQITGGKLRGLLDVRDKTIPDLQANLDELTQQLSQTLNQIHNRGTSLPNVSSRYQGTRVFAQQGNVVPTTGEAGSVFYKGSTAISAATYGTLSFAANATNPWQTTITASSGTPFAAGTFAVGQTFSIGGSTTSANDGTYKVVGYNSANQIVVEKANPRQTMQLQNSDDVVLATFDSLGNQLQQTTLNTIMQSDYSSAYTAATTGAGRSLSDFQAKNDHDQWSIGEVSAHMEGWLRSQGYSNASVNLDSDGKMVVDLGDASTSLVFRDQSSSAAGGTAADATINFDVNGDGAMDQQVKGFSSFFGLNDLYVNSAPAMIQDSAVQPDTFKLATTRDLTLYDTSGKLGNTVTLPQGATLQQIADAINRQSQTNDSAALNVTSWNLTTPATINISDASGALFSVPLGAGVHSLEEIAGKLTQAPVSAQVVQDGSATRLRLVDSRGTPLTVSIDGGNIMGSSLNLNDTLAMTPTQRVQASVVPEGSGYRLRVRQTTGDTLYLSSTQDGRGQNLLSDLTMANAATGSAGSTEVRSDLQTAPAKLSRGTMQWNADTSRYYISEGDNTTTLQIVDAMNSKTSMDTAGSIHSGKYSFAEYAAAAIGVVATNASNSKSQMSYQTTLNSSLDFQNSAYSGVNLDEEISSLMDYQQAYSAAAKVITTLQDMLETLTSMIR